MKKILREPLVHFLLAGLILFGLYGYFDAKAQPEADDTAICIGQARIERLRAAWEKQWRRPPTKDELERMIEQFIQEEVLYREALAMGLEKDDTIVRRRLAQKMKFLIQDIADRMEPTEGELRAFFEENRDQFKSAARISFSHVYFNPDRREADAVQEARLTLASLKSNNPEQAPELGDPFMLHYDYVEITLQDALGLFGREFAKDLFELEPGSWQGPLRSGYGLHLVRIHEYIPARMPEFVEASVIVLEEYKASQRRQANREIVERLKGRYRIEVDTEALQRDNSPTLTVEGGPLRQNYNRGQDGRKQ